MRDFSRYTITIRLEMIDGEALYVGHVAEFPDVQAYEETYAAAERILHEAISILEDIAAERRSAE